MINNNPMKRKKESKKAYLMSYSSPLSIFLLSEWYTGDNEIHSTMVWISEKNHSFLKKKKKRKMHYYASQNKRLFA